MANHQSALKRARQNEIRRMRNKSTKTQLKNVIQKVRLAAADRSGADALNELNTGQVRHRQSGQSRCDPSNEPLQGKFPRLSRLVNAPTWNRVCVQGGSVHSAYRPALPATGTGCRAVSDQKSSVMLLNARSASR